jgi:hypothetical protein
MFSARMYEENNLNQKDLAEDHVKSINKYNSLFRVLERSLFDNWVLSFYSVLDKRKDTASFLNKNKKEVEDFILKNKNIIESLKKQRHNFIAHNNKTLNRENFIMPSILDTDKYIEDLRLLLNSFLPKDREIIFDNLKYIENNTEQLFNDIYKLQKIEQVFCK